MTPPNDLQFNHYYSLHCKHLQLKGYQPKTIDAYSRTIRRVGAYFDYNLDDLSEDAYSGQSGHPIRSKPAT